MREVASNSTPPRPPPPPLDVASRLPLHLVNYQTIPPAPSRSNSGFEPVADFLLDFTGRSWIAYGASSLLVISHFPNPLSEEEIRIGPIYGQVVELSREAAGCISAVSWSPVTPSVGELAVALGDCIVLLAYCEDEIRSGSFCWSQTAVFVQSSKVEAIKWTGSGDGIISVGTEVVMWRRKEKSWEIAWEFKPKVSQTLVSTSWSVDGLLATAPSSKVKLGSPSSSPNEERNCVLICQGDGPCQNPQTELDHPMPVSMIQWRPSTGRPLSRHTRHAFRQVLLTCCFDGAVRLWGEIDDGRIRRAGKDNCDHKATELSFCVIAVIEVNQTVNGFLGLDVFVRWATEVEGIANLGGKACYFSCSDDSRHDSAGRCEWLVGFGPKNVATFWAIHCLDDFAPVRFPRVTLWKKHYLTSFEMETNQLLIHKILMMRTQDSGPPAYCSLVHLLPHNSFSWAHFYSEASTHVEGHYANDSNNENPLTACARGLLEVEGHTGKIVQIAIHPFTFEVNLAASLDTEGTLLFWSFSTFFNSHTGLPASSPSWKFCGKTSFSDHSPYYTCLCWAPTLLGMDQVLLMGHADGIDWFAVNLNSDEGIPHHKLFSIPFSIGDHGQRPSRVCSIPLPSICNGKFVSSKFLLLVLWMDNFRALSWEITIHCSSDLSGSCCNEHLKTFECEVSDKKYCVTIDPSSSDFPVPHNDDKVISCDVVYPRDLVWSAEQKLSSSDKMGCCSYAYHIITGCSNGTLKLWRSMPVQSPKSATNWDLVGVLTSEEGPILAVSPSACCLKIATVSKTNQPNISSTLCVWECMHVQSAGSYMLQDKLYFDGEIVALKWMSLGNGQLLLGVCLQNGLHIYAQRRCGGQYNLKCEKPSEGNSWVCIAVNGALPTISDFLWGPKGTAVVVHDEYFCLFSHFLSLSEYTSSKKYARCTNFSVLEQPQMKIIGGQYQSPPPSKMNARGGLKSNINLQSSESTCKFTRLCFWSMSEIAEMIGGSLPLFHPEALLVNLYSGNWKRALIALCHLVKHFASNSFSKEGHGAKLSSSIVCPVPLSNYFEEHPPPSSSDKLFQWSSSSLQTELSEFAQMGGYDILSTSMTSSRSQFDDFMEAFERLYRYKYITEVEKMQALSLIDLLQEVSNHHTTSAYGSLDEPGRRFWISVRYQQLYFARRFKRLPLVEEIAVSSNLFGWAFHSDCHDNLFNSLLPTMPSWEEMCSMGVGFWYTNVTQLRAKMEQLARQRYMKQKDPKASALLYIALSRPQVLAGLFKISKDEKDKPLAGFLSRNFQEDKNKQAALKNAYVLLGKHQLELAVAFFLLGGDASSAVTVCAKNLGDEQLALVICRLLEGYGGQLERELITKLLLPSAVSKGDYWMASYLEWVLGNYSQSFLRMIGIEMGSEDNISILSSSHVSFLDPSIGQYCFVLAMKTSMKNAIGELNAAAFCRLATLMNATSFTRCGLHIEALECLSSSFSLFGGTTHGILMHSSTCGLSDILKPSVDKSSSNWISDEMYTHFISHCKLRLAMQYMSNVLREHPSCVSINKSFSVEFVNHATDRPGYEQLLKKFQDNLTSSITYFQQRFSLVPHDLVSMIVLSLHHNGLEFVGHYILQECIIEFLSEEKSNGAENLAFYPSNLLVRATQEISVLCVKYIVQSCKNCYSLAYLARDSLVAEGKFCWLSAWGFSNQGITWTFRHLRAMLQLFLRSNSEEYLKLLSTILDLFEYNVLFASAWLQKDFKVLLIAVKPILATLLRGRMEYEINMTEINKLSAEVEKLLTHDLVGFELGVEVESNESKQEQSGEVPVERIWHVMIASLWIHMSKFLQHQVDTLSEALTESCSSQSLLVLDCDTSESVSGTLIGFLKLSCTDISSYCPKQFATYLLQGAKESNKCSFFYFEDGPSNPGATDNYEMSENTDGRTLSVFEELWHLCNDPKIIHVALLQEYQYWSYFKHKSSGGWSDAYINITKELGSEETCDKEDKVGSPSHSSGSPLACLSPDDHPFKGSGDKDLHDSKRIAPFQNPKEIYKRNGELLEALCINSIDQCQAALASNRKGIIFFKWEDGVLHGDKSKYIWEEADWPHNGWAGSESIPVPTYVSPGVGLGSKEGAHLGLGGATTGAGALVKRSRDLKGGGFGMPGYAGVGASNLGWGVQEGFDEYLDPPATVDNVRTMAFASHPSRSFFLVGSSNTHVYLWEFGKDKATATYGVLPAANVPPPYALASVSAVRFDHCGHRFVTGALDGTVCTWQLEVGGRSNICPTESSVCFNNHTADVTYVTASGSIVAAAGYSSSGVNVVVWDTLAPPATSKASIMCHEGGARSLAVFDNDIGSGSISPLILTGGKGGDVGLHDFRYIATGRAKKHKHLDTGEHSMNSSSVHMRSKTGDQNRNGMLWYIPKAHSASVTKICTIANTSFFLTGSKDGDVKLWDAKRAKLVFHWSRLHERQTFLQPSSRGFGRVVRAAVTDIEAVSHGFITCGGDGSVKFIRFEDFPSV